MVISNRSRYDSRHHRPSSHTLFKHSLPYDLACEAFTAHSACAQSMQFSSLASTPDGNDLLLLNARQSITGWIDQNESSKLKLSDGSNTSLNAAVNQAQAFQTDNGGVLAGYFSYEIAHCLEDLPAPLKACTSLPDVFLGCYDQWIEINHQAKTAQFFSSDIRVKEYKTQTDEPLKFNCLSNFVKSEHKDNYMSNVNRILDYINAGDCYQINYAQHFSAPYSGSSYKAFKAISEAITAPYAGYVNTGFGELLSFSPEQFIQADPHGNVRTRPIKGTAKRGNSEQDDATIAADLLASEKNRAENLMIVDLLRHDLGKCCELGSIKVDELFKLESFTNVHHLVSTISGKLKPSSSPLSALLASFPGGSITGAPKIRAMEIINELESRARSAYCGSMFYQKPDGSFDSNIMIRTLVASDNTLHCWGGGGIVADSTPEQEHQETLDKVEMYMDIIEKIT